MESIFNPQSIQYKMQLGIYNNTPISAILCTIQMQTSFSFYIYTNLQKVTVRQTSNHQQKKYHFPLLITYNQNIINKLPDHQTREYQRTYLQKQLSQVFLKAIIHNIGMQIKYCQIARFQQIQNILLICLNRIIEKRTSFLIVQYVLSLQIFWKIHIINPHQLRRFLQNGFLCSQTQEYIHFFKQHCIQRFCQFENRTTHQTFRLQHFLSFLSFITKKVVSIIKILKIANTLQSIIRTQINARATQNPILILPPHLNSGYLHIYKTQNINMCIFICALCITHTNTINHYTINLPSRPID
eukprot:TRINITY_DN21051_c0_g1_i4.p1 TRINITY_DN21051_c0_g1~~TRINITY_DN21051_c0_g1_i4.p1  ORF type:complete len:299 (+),score=-32.72 TRINITY_DN21051_c0_g1_i4:86-982(+)